MATRLERAAKAYGRFGDYIWERIASDITTGASGLDLSLSELNALFEMKDVPDSTVSDIAKHTNLSLAAASQLVERMVKRGLVLRQEDPKNRRQKHLRLTKEGAKLLESFDANYEKATRDLLGHLPDPLLVRFEKLFTDINVALEKKGLL